MVMSFGARENNDINGTSFMPTQETKSICFKAQKIDDNDASNAILSRRSVYSKKVLQFLKTVLTQTHTGKNHNIKFM